MSDSLNPSQLTTLCVVFVAFHLLALPAFFWAMRHRQFSGAEQRVWSLEEEGTVPFAPTAPPDARRVRWMLAVLLTLGTLMLSSIVVTMAMALHAPAHPVSSVGKCPF